MCGTKNTLINLTWHIHSLCDLNCVDQAYIVDLRARLVKVIYVKALLSRMQVAKRLRSKDLRGAFYWSKIKGISDGVRVLICFEHFSFLIGKFYCIVPHLQLGNSISQRVR